MKKCIQINMNFIKRLFTCSKDGCTIKLNNRLVQEDLYGFLTDGEPEYGFHISRSSNYTKTSAEFQLVRRIDDDTVMYYPYETSEDMENDYEELMRLIKKLKK